MHKSIALAVLSVLFLSAPVLAQFTGKATWFNDNGNGTCGETDTNTAVALPSDLYDNGANCNKWVTITDVKTGQTESGQVLDECEDCDSNDLDLSEALFQKFASSGDGTFPITWDFSQSAEV